MVQPEVEMLNQEVRAEETGRRVADNDMCISGRVNLL